MDNSMNDLIFNTARELYKNLRMLELNKIKNYLEPCTDLGVTKTSIYQGKFGCDNWLGLDVIINDEKAFFISLQTFDENSENGNTYVVMDRIGIYKYTNSNGKLETIDALKKMKPTSITLPMDDDKLKQLVELLK